MERISGDTVKFEWRNEVAAICRALDTYSKDQCVTAKQTQSCKHSCSYLTEKQTRRERALSCSLTSLFIVFL